MENELTRAEQQLIESLCAAYPQWLPEASAAPEALRMLDGGYSNRSILLRSSTGDWILRLSGPVRRGVCRQRERRALSVAAAEQLCPELRLCDPEAGILISRYVPVEADARPGPMVLAQLLRRIHQLPWDTRREDNRQDTLAAIQALREQLSSTHELHAVLEASQRITRRSERLLTGRRHSESLCHNDLLPANQLQFDDRLLAIDWEYAGSNDPFFDLAVCASAEQAPASFALNLLEQYLERAALARERERLAAWRLQYAMLEALWFAIHAPESAAASAAYRGFVLAAERELDLV